MKPALMSAKESRTPADLWWLVVLVVLAAGLTWDWSVMTSLVASVAAALVLGLAHVVVMRRRRSPVRR
ncbi:hypothetical protein [Georgenia sp. H159]|uniref:hypothetical protein n=1 Tax=Georgenia sp. H159 TaxID=3076115 RepID=UPI002D782EC3|nr:hypothetical protein [Georgenia sp. H159]